MKKEKELLQEQLEALQMKRKPEAIREFLLKHPNRKWASPKLDKEMLSFDLFSSINPSMAKMAAKSVNLEDFISFNQGYEHVLSVKKVDELTRMEAKGASLYGNDFAYISDPENGFVYLDKKDCTYVQLGKEQQIKTTFGALKGKIKSIEKGQENGLTKVELTIQYPKKAKQILYFDPKSNYVAQSKQVFNTVYHCSDKMTKSGIDCDQLMQLGMLVSGDFYLMKSGKKYKKASSFKIKNISLEAYDQRWFEIPADYKNYRLNKGEKQGEKYTYGKAIPFSEIRNKKKRFKDNSSSNKGEVPLAGTTESSQSSLSYSSVSKALTHLDEKNLNFPECHPSTYGSQIANLVDQQILDDTRYLLNGITRRLNSFQGVGGTLDIDWLAQFEAHANSLGGGNGSGLFHLLRDNTLGGTGLLDKLAEVEARSLMLSGDLTSLSLNPALSTNINVVIANAAIAPTDRFDSLTDADQRDLREAYLEQRIAHIVLNYPGNVPTQTVLAGLLNIRVDDIEFDVNVNNSSVLSALNVESDFVRLDLALPLAGGRARISRWPTAKFFGALVLGGLACFFFPPACAIIAVASVVALFLSVDINEVDLSIADIVVNAEIRFVPNAENVLQPDVTLTLNGNVNLSFSSAIPSGIHQITALLINVVGNQTDLIINILESQLQTQLNNFLKQDLNITYPPTFGPVALSGISNFTEFTADESLYIQTRLDAGTLGIVNPYITQVDRNIKDNIFNMRDDFKAQFTDPVDQFNAPGVSAFNWTSQNFEQIARYYLGSVFSQNFINHYIHTLWRKHDFTYLFNDTEKEEIFKLIEPFFPEIQGIDPERIKMAIWPSTSPRTVFTPKLVKEDGRYATTFFDDLRLCIAIPNDDDISAPNLEFLFASQLYTELGFGGLKSDTGKLDFIKLDDQVFDLYFDLENIGVEVIHPEIQSMAIPNMAFDSSFDYSVLDRPEMQDAFTLAVEFMLKNKNSKVIPKSSTDGNVHIYDIGTPAIQVLSQLVPFNQNLYVSMGLTGPATAIYEGALDIDQMNELVGTIIRSVI